LKELWDQFADFFAKNDFQSLLEMIRQVEWKEVLRNFYVWATAVPILAFILITKKIRLLVFIISLGLFVVLLQIVLPEKGQQLPLLSLLQFIGGVFVLVVVNLYFLFMRE
jgi:hypothetical protein